MPLSFIPFNTLLGRTHGVEEISREENLKHTAAFRLALGKTITNLQASWVKMGLDAATESLRWGVNDLGGTLMEENISRMAGSQHGVRLEPAAADRGRAPGRPRARPSARRSTRSSRRTERAPCGTMGCMRAMVLDGQRRPLRLEELPDPRARARRRSCCGSAPAASAAPTCTWSTATSPSRSCRSSRATRSSATVEATGEGAERFAVGERVGVPWLGWTDGDCRVLPLGPGEPLRASAVHRLQLDGGYAELAVADERYCFPIPDGYPTSRPRRCCAPG